MIEKSKYKSLAEWREANPQAYIAAVKKRLLSKICEHFGWFDYKERIKWTK